MKRHIISAMGAVLAMLAGGSAANAEGLGFQADYGRADGHWGTELGAGYSLGFGGFSLTPGGGVFLHNGGTRAFGRVEASYSLPASATLGIGVRVSSANTRPYATVALPLLPKVAIKGNAGPKYYALGLTIGY